MYASELSFMEKFLAVLSKMEVKQIPFDNDIFKIGVQKMRHYFDLHRANFGQHQDELELLFLEYTSLGDYTEMIKIMSNMNGRIISLENPSYVRANIKIDNEYMEYLIDQNTLEIENSCFYEIAEAFCLGAGLSYKLGVGVDGI